MKDKNCLTNNDGFNLLSEAAKQHNFEICKLAIDNMKKNSDALFPMQGDNGNLKIFLMPFLYFFVGVLVATFAFWLFYA